MNAFCITLLVAISDCVRFIIADCGTNRNNDHFNDIVSTAVATAHRKYDDAQPVLNRRKGGIKHWIDCLVSGYTSNRNTCVDIACDVEALCAAYLVSSSLLSKCMDTNHAFSLLWTHHQKPSLAGYVICIICPGARYYNLATALYTVTRVLSKLRRTEDRLSTHYGLPYRGSRTRRDLTIRGDFNAEKAVKVYTDIQSVRDWKPFYLAILMTMHEMVGFFDYGTPLRTFHPRDANGDNLDYIRICYEYRWFTFRQPLAIPNDEVIRGVFYQFGRRSKSRTLEMRNEHILWDIIKPCLQQNNGKGWLLLGLMVDAFIIGMGRENVASSALTIMDSYSDLMWTNIQENLQIIRGESEGNKDTADAEVECAVDVCQKVSELIVQNLLDMDDMKQFLILYASMHQNESLKRFMKNRCYMM